MNTVTASTLFFGQLLSQKAALTGGQTMRPVTTPTTVSPERAVTSRVRCDQNVASRKMALLKRSGLFGTDTKGATIERACSAEDLREAYRLVHSVYLGTGYIKPEPANIRLRIFEATSETATFIAKKDGQVVGVLSVVGDSRDLGLPSDTAFKSELDTLRANGTRLCEITNQAVADGYRKSAVPTELMRCAVNHCMKVGYDLCVATVSPSHNGFYDLVGFNQIGAERSYSAKVYDPVIALGMDINLYRNRPDDLSATEEFIHDFTTHNSPYLNRVVDWARQAKKQFLNAELLEQLFVMERNFLAECSLAELQILERRWGQELFATVTLGADIPALAETAVETTAAYFAGEEKTVSEELVSAGSSFFAPWRIFPDLVSRFADYLHRLADAVSLRAAKAASSRGITLESGQQWSRTRVPFPSVAEHKLAIAGSG